MVVKGCVKNHESFSGLSQQALLWRSARGEKRSSAKLLRNSRYLWPACLRPWAERRVSRHPNSLAAVAAAVTDRVMFVFVEAQTTDRATDRDISLSLSLSLSRSLSSRSLSSRSVWSDTLSVAKSLGKCSIFSIEFCDLNRVIWQFPFLFGIRLKLLYASVAAA